MRRLSMILIVLALGLTMTSVAFCDDQEDYGTGHMMGPGFGWGSGYMMGPGHHMMDYGHRGWGMHGHGWQSMKPEDREKWEKMRREHLKDTLELRKQLATKQLELETLWAQPDVDQKKVEQLSNEVAELRAELGRKRDKYLMQCRHNFGDQGWACPGSWW